MLKFELRWSAWPLAFAAIAWDVHAADTVAGRAVVEQQCAECHRHGDWNGETAPALESLINDIVDAKVRHPRELQLTRQQAADVAAYWTTGRARK